MVVAYLFNLAVAPEEVWEGFLKRTQSWVSRIMALPIEGRRRKGHPGRDSSKWWAERGISGTSKASVLLGG